MINNDKELTRELVEDYLWRFGEVEFDEPKWELRVHGQALDLEPRPLEVLNLMLRHAGEVVTKDEFFEAVWPGAIAGEKALTNAVAKLRKAIGDEDQSVIETVHKVGYRFVAALTRKVVGRRTVARLSLKQGDPVPRREQWQLVRSLDVSVRSEVWLAEHLKTREKRVFKFSPDGARLSSLKREATLSRVLTETLGVTPDFIRVLEWNFEEPPYFLECEYGGQDWAAWAESRGGLDKVPQGERLGLFVQAAEAVAAAHSVGVLHKDLKPANLLIESRKEGGWQVRLTDFGSGKLIDPAALADLGVTRMGFTQTQSVDADSLTGTPLYLAPELFSGQPPTQATDVYALGIILYQLVVCDLKKPLSSGWEEEIADDILREDISAAVNGNPASRLKLADELATRVRTLELRRQQRKIEVERQEKLRHLQEQSDRAKVRRPWVIAALLVLLVGLVASSALFFRERQSALEATRQRDAADSTIKFVTQSLVAYADPARGGRTDIPFRDVLLKAQADIEPLFSSQPQVEGKLRESMGDAFDNLGLMPEGTANWQKAIALNTQVYGSASEAVLTDHYWHAYSIAGREHLEDAASEIKATDQSFTLIRKPDLSLRFARAQAHQRVAILQYDYSTAKSYALESAEIAQKLPNYPAADLIRLRLRYGQIVQRTGAIDEARKLLEDLIPQIQHQVGADSYLMVMALSYLSEVEEIQKQFDQAEAHGVKAVELGDRVLGPDHNVARQAKAGLGNVYIDEKRYADAELIYRQLLESMRKDGDWPGTYSMVMINNLAMCVGHTKGSRAGLEIYRQGISDAQAAGKSNEPPFHLMLENAITLSFNVGGYDDAQHWFSMIDEKKFASALTHPQVAPARMAMFRGKLALHQGDFDIAETNFKTVIDVLSTASPQDTDIADAKLLAAQAQRHEKLTTPLPDNSGG